MQKFQRPKLKLIFKKTPSKFCLGWIEKRLSKMGEIFLFEARKETFVSDFPSTAFMVGFNFC